MPNSKNNPPSTKKKVSLLPYGFKAKAERTSAQYRSYLKLNEHDPLPAGLLTSYLNIYVKELHEVANISQDCISDLLSDFTGAFSAVTLYCPANDRYMIVHNHTHSTSRRESNLMHECAHLILGHKMEEFDNSNGITLRNYNNVQEEEAKYLGHCLQLPKASLTRYYVYGNKTKSEMSEIFNASSEVVNYRFRICNIEGFKKSAQKYIRG